MGADARRRLARACLAAAVAVLGAPGASGASGGSGGTGGTAPEFGPYRTYAVGADPTGVAIADVTGDDRNDVLVSIGGRIFNLNPNEYQLAVYPQLEDGTLGAPTRIPSHDAPGGHDPVGMDVGDVNGDGLVDVAMGTNAGIDLFVQGPSGLLPPVLIPTSAMVTQVEIGDLEGDDAVDMLAATTAEVIYFKHLHDLVFVPVTVTAQQHEEVELADVSGGDYLDVIGYSGSTVRVFRSHTRTIAPQTKETYFEPAQEYVAGAADESGAGLAVGDVTGDGMNDVMLTMAASGANARVVVFAQEEGLDHPEGEPTLEAGVPHPAADFPGAAEAADLDGDELAELLTLHADRLGVFRATSGGGLASECLVPMPVAGAAPKSLTVGDVTGDGAADVVVAADEDGLVVFPRATGKGPSALTLGGPSAAMLGEHVALAGALDLQGGCPTEGQAVSIFATAPDGARFQIGSATTDADGSFAFSYRPSAGGRFSYEAGWEGSATRVGSLSDPVDVMIRRSSSVDLAAASGSLIVGDPVLLSGSVVLQDGTPVPGQAVAIHRTGPDGSRSQVGTVTTAQDGGFGFGDTPPEVGTFVYQAEWTGDAGADGSASDPVDVLVKRLPSSLSLTSDAPVVDHGGAATLRARLQASGADGAVVEIYQTPVGGARSLLTSGAVGASGELSVQVTPERSTTYEAVWAGDARHTTPAPARVDVQVRASVSGGTRGGYRVKDGVRLIHRGKKASYETVVAPAHPGDAVVVIVQRRVAGAWKTVRRMAATIAADGRAVAALPTSKLGTYRVRATFEDHADHLGATTPWSRHRITP